MLTSTGNHYVRPEYLNPIQGNSIELDAKKSPLALLAQTCSSIGADLSQKGGSIPPGEKGSSKGKASPGAKSPAAALTISPSDEPKTSSTSSSSSSSFKPYEKKKDDDDQRTSVTPKRSSPHTRSPGASQPSVERSSSRESDGGRSSSRPHDPPPASSSSSLSPRVSSPITPKISSSLSSHGLSSLSDLTKDPLAAYKLAPSLYPHLALGLDPLGAAGLSALTAKVPTSTAAALSSPYISYARVKTASGSETVVPVCRDPYCAGCQINAHAAQVVNGTCPPACSQCAQISAHTKNLASIPGLLPTLPASSLSSLYPPPGLLGSGSPHPYVCNWIAGDTYCGKRFASSEDLLQHLRTHTNLTASETTLSLHALHHPLLAGHLPRGYPTPPLSPLSAARYHPYAKPPASHLPPTAPLPASALTAASLSALPPHPLSAYYNPYSLYARGLGATTGLN